MESFGLYSFEANVFHAADRLWDALFAQNSNSSIFIAESCGSIPVGYPVHLLKDVWSFPLFRNCVLLCSQCSCTDGHVNVRVHVSRVNTQEWECWAMWYMFNLRRNCQIVSRVSVPFCVAISNVWDFQWLLSSPALGMFKLFSFLIGVQWD